MKLWCQTREVTTRVYSSDLRGIPSPLRGRGNHRLISGINLSNYVVVNRVHDPLNSGRFPGDQDIRDALSSHDLDPGMQGSVTSAVNHQNGLSRRDAANLRELQQGLNGMNGTLIVRVPALSIPVDNLRNLARVLPVF